jgi:hypothetical protein
MSASPPCVVSPHTRFLEYQDRRRRLAAVSTVLAAEYSADGRDAREAMPTAPPVSEADSKT